MARSDTGDHPQMIIPPPLNMLLPLVLGVLIHYLILPLNFGPIWVGGLIAVLACAGIFMAIREFRRAGENVDPKAPSTALIESGLYRYSRNPIYLCFLIAQCGLSLLMGTWWGVVTAPLAFVGFHYLAVLPEEAYLEHKLGDPYQHYRERVRRWI